MLHTTSTDFQPIPLAGSTVERSDLLRSHGLVLAAAPQLIEADVAALRSIELRPPPPGFPVVAPIVDVEIRIGEFVALTAAITEGLKADIRLRGRWIRSGLRINEGGFQFRLDKERATPDFVAQTVMAAVGLSDGATVSIPDADVCFRIGGRASLAEISRTLKRRQLIEWLMVVEAAAGIEVDLPGTISSADGSNLAIAYKAITERSFDWPVRTLSTAVPNTPETATFLAELGKAPSMPPDDHVLQTGPTVIDCFGHPVDLGEGTLLLHKAVVLSIEDERDARPDGSRFKSVRLRSTVGAGTYTFPQAPTISQTSFDPLVRNCIDAGPSLAGALAKRYAELAYSTLSDLTDDQKRQVTEPSDFGPDAFVGDEP